MKVIHEIHTCDRCKREFWDTAKKKEIGDTYGNATIEWYIDFWDVLEGSDYPRKGHGSIEICTDCYNGFRAWIDAGKPNDR